MANGSQFKSEYDINGNLISQTDCSGYTTQYHYDDKQRIQQIINAEGYAVTYHYDDSKPWLGSLLSRIEYPDGNSIVMQYNESGLLTQKRDEALETLSSIHYAVDGLVTKQTDALGKSTTYAYDDLRRLSQLTNENGEHWTFHYNKDDQLIYETRFDNYQSQYQYDALGNLIDQIDNPKLPVNQQRHVRYERDIVGQIQVQESKNAQQIIRTSYQFDQAGQLLSATNPYSTIEFGYDADGQLITEKQINKNHVGVDTEDLVRELQHQYDALGNRIATTLPDGKIIKQMHYGSGHLYNQSLFDPMNDQTVELRHSERNKLHQEIFRKQGNLDSVFNHDPMGRLLEQQSEHAGHIVMSRQYQYDALGQLTDIKGQTSVAGSDNKLEPFNRNHHYQYDAVGRLTEHKLNSQNSRLIEQFAFDPTGNRVSSHSAKQATQSTSHLSHNRPTELMSNGKRIRYSYDEHGRVANKTITSSANQSDNSLVQFKKELRFSYNPNNELIKTELKAQTGSETTTTTTHYYYDAFGRRIQKQSETSQRDGAQTKSTQVLWDGDQAIQEYSDTHVYTTIYDQGGFEPVARAVWLKEGMKLVANDEPEDSYNDDDNLSAKPELKQSDIEVFYYHNDQLGTPNELTTQDGEVVWLADFEAWGNTAKVVWREEKLGQLKVSADELQPIRFQGQSYDTETGLHYNRFRYFDPDLGMFTTRDPIGLLGGSNVFQYAPNPTGWIDPLGLEVYQCQAINETGGGNGEQLDKNGDMRKICTYSCLGKEPERIIIRSTSSINSGGSEYCRGAKLKTTVTPSGQVTEETERFENFSINTDSWYWDGWGRTEDIYEKLKTHDD